MIGTLDAAGGAGMLKSPEQEMIDHLEKQI